MKYQLVWIPPSAQVHVADCETFEEASNTPHNADEIVDDGKWQIHVYTDEWIEVRDYELQSQEWKMIREYRSPEIEDKR